MNIEKIEKSIKKENPPKKEASGDSSDIELLKKIENIKNTIIAAIKIITIACMTDDEETSTDFLSSFENYVQISSIAQEYGLSNGRIPSSDLIFKENPTRCWIEFLIMCFSTLFTIPNNGIVKCDAIGMNHNDKDNKTDSVGICFNAIVTLEAYDWKEHTVELFIPSDDRTHKTLFSVDGNITLFC